MSLSVTQCPACESTFNITARILESAGGKVRCGSCLTVFEAPENIVEYGDDSHDSEESVFVGSDPGNYFDPSTFLTRQSLKDSIHSEEARQEPVEPFEQPSAHRAHDESVEPQPALDEEADFLDAVADGTSGGEPSEASVAEPENPQEEIQEALQEEEEAEAETEAQQEVEAETHAAQEEADEEEQAPVTSPASYSPYSPYAHYGMPEQEPTPEDFRLHASFSLQPSPYSPSRQANPGQPPTAEHEDPGPEAELQQPEPASEDEFLDAVNQNLAHSDSETELPETALDWSLAAGDELQEDPEAIEDIGEAVDTAGDQTAQAESAGTDIEDRGEAVEEETVTVEVDQSVEAIRARALQAQLKDDEALEAIPSENLQALGKFSTPVEILAGKPRSLRRQLTWSALALLGTVMLAAQYLWQEMDNFSQNDTLRPWYETACQWLDCELPVYSDIDAIRANNLAVRSHPEVDNALAVNIEFQNSSPFAQQFPVLILSFNAANNSVIALREFSASEYLPQQLRNRRLMPAQTPIQIDLSIIDPGRDAVNYTLAFRRP